MKLKFFVGCIAIFSTILFSCTQSNPSTPTDSSSETEEEGAVVVSGTVKDNQGNPIPDVVVSDCVKCVKTDALGRYSLSTTKKKFIYVSTPGGYKSPSPNGKVDYYKNIYYSRLSSKPIEVDFELEKIEKDSENYKVLFIADPQPRARTAGYDKFAYHSLDVCDDLIEDIKLYASTINDDDYFTITLGDLLHENMSLYPDYYNAVMTTGIPAYSMLGNHDHNRTDTTTDEEAAFTFETYFGPTYYSFNAGNIHFIVLDNIIMYPPSSSYDYGLTDEQWTWLQNDLSFVDKSTTLVISAHQPLFDISEGDFLIQDETLHQEDYKELLSQYAKVYCWAGHRHHSYNCIYDDPKLVNVEQHIAARSTGPLWLNEWINYDGVPRGFVVMDVKGNEVSWIFHPCIYQKAEFIGPYKPDYKDRPWDYVNGIAVMKDTGKVLDESYQMHVYAPGAYNDTKVYASIFMWDKKWEEPTFEVNGQKRTMEMKLMYDKLGMDCHDFYYTRVKQLIAEGSSGVWNYENYQNLWGCDVSDIPHGKGVVSVKDRFGNVFTSDVEW